eukprot:4415790-Alexandrium_andersonii.AAC.1
MPRQLRRVLGDLGGVIDHEDRDNSTALHGNALTLNQYHIKNDSANGALMERVCGLSLKDIREI